MNLSLYKFFVNVASFFYPNRCTGCFSPLTKQQDYLCVDCIFNLPTSQEVSALDNELYYRVNSFSEIEGGLYYLFFSEDGIARNMIHSIKYENNTKLAEYLAARFAVQLKSMNIECVIPVPLHEKKKRKRGYNQSDFIAKGIAKALSIDWKPDVLLRLKNTSTQTRKGLESRVLNVKNAFIVKKKEVISGKRILLVDDVITTGATVSECIKVLRKANPTTINVASLAFAH